MVAYKKNVYRVFIRPCVVLCSVRLLQLAHFVHLSHTEHNWPNTFVNWAPIWYLLHQAYRLHAWSAWQCAQLVHSLCLFGGGGVVAACSPLTGGVVAPDLPSVNTGSFAYMLADMPFDSAKVVIKLIVCI